MNVIAASDLPNAPGPHWRIGALASDSYSAPNAEFEVRGSHVCVLDVPNDFFSSKSRFKDSGNDWIRTSDLALMKRPLCR